MTARAALTAATWAVEAASSVVLWLPVPPWAGVPASAVIVSGIALTWQQAGARVLPDGGQDFLLLRFWDVFWLWRGGDSLAGAWRQCFGGQRAQPPP